MSWNEQRVAQFSIACFPGFGSRSLRKIFAAFPDPRAAWLANTDAFIAAGLTEEAAQKFIAWRNETDPHALLEPILRDQIRVIFRGEPDYPPAFEQSSDPPEILFVRGTLRDIPAVSVVGTRRMTSYGARCLELIIPELARAGLAIISGLALGVDAEAHRQTLQAKGITVAILGTGVDDASIYPRENFSLAQDILANDGALISEFPPGTSGRKEHFPMRNRLIAALGMATLVVEADMESGSLITAGQALEENREVLAIPGPIWNETSRGTNALIKSGAKVCTCSQDVLEALSLDRPDLVAEARKNLPLDSTETEILSNLREPKHIDDIARMLELDAAAISAKMAMLEMKGYVKPMGGQVWIKTPGI